MERPRAPSPGCTRASNKHEENDVTLPEPTSILYLGPTASIAQYSSKEARTQNTGPLSVPQRVSSTRGRTAPRSGVWALQR
eukprot:595658-Pyramimonas_sp.AAC.1